jgi:hypothetical protein
MSITQPAFVFVALGNQQAMRMRHTDICSPFRSTKFFPHYLINRNILEEKKVTEHNACFDFLYNFCL